MILKTFFFYQINFILWITQCRKHCNKSDFESLKWVSIIHYCLSVYTVKLIKAIFPIYTKKKKQKEEEEDGFGLKSRAGQIEEERGFPCDPKKQPTRQGETSDGTSWQCRDGPSQKTKKKHKHKQNTIKNQK